MNSSIVSKVTSSVFYDWSKIKKESGQENMLVMYLLIVETPEERSLFEQIYYTYRKQMFYVANQVLDDEHLAEDALQEAFLGVAKQITLFQNMPHIKIRAYVLTAAKNAKTS